MEPDELLFVGDRADNVGAALELGILSVRFDPAAGASELARRLFGDGA